MVLEALPRIEDEFHLVRSQGAVHCSAQSLVSVIDQDHKLFSPPKAAFFSHPVLLQILQSLRYVTDCNSMSYVTIE